MDDSMEKRADARKKGEHYPLWTKLSEREGVIKQHQKKAKSEALKKKKESIVGKHMREDYQKGLKNAKRTQDSL